MLAVYPRYNDWWLKIPGALFCAHFVEAIGREESFFQLLPRKSYQLALLSGFVIALILWELISRVSAWLDVHYDWFTKPVARICLQLILGVFLVAVLLYVLTLLQMRVIFHQDIQQVEYLLYEFPISCVLIFLINLFYLTWYLYNRAMPGVAPAVTVNETVEAPVAPVILVSKGAQQLPLPASEIAYVYRNEDYTYIKTFTGEQFLVNYSLDELEASLDASLFFRANRQMIIQRKSCRSFSPGIW